MYSYEDRIRAVEVYIKLGKRVKATSWQLGYPTKNALKVWYREHPLRLPYPATQRLCRATELARYRGNGRPLRVVFTLVLKHHPDRPLLNFF